MNTPVFKGAKIDLSGVKSSRLDALLFGETQSRVVVSTSADHAEQVLAKAQASSVPATVIGKVTGCCKAATLDITTATASTLSWSIPALHSLWWNALAEIMD